MSTPRRVASPSVLREAAQPPDHGPGLPFVVALDDTDSPFDVVDALALAPFTSGEQPWARTARIDRVRPGASLLPPGARVLRTVVEDRRDSRLAVGDGWTLRAVRWRAGAEVSVTAVSDELARAVLGDAVRDVTAEPTADNVVTMGFWYLSGRHGPTRATRTTATTSWASIRGNYAQAALEPLDALMAVRPDAVAGRIILLHGPTGTGKTAVLRTLAHEWRRWCQVDCVLDPEALFAEPGYLMEVAIGSDDDQGDDDGSPDGLPREPAAGPVVEAVVEPAGDAEDAGEAAAGARGGAGVPDDGRRRWRLLVIEDCDDLIRGDGRSVSGQALSRLLNLTDGLVGQGREVLVALTTNQNLAHLHPAILRPGRCMAQVEIGPLPHDEAARWLGTSAGVGPTMTLAELFARRDGGTPLRTTPPETHDGLYM